MDAAELLNKFRSMFFPGDPTYSYTIDGPVNTSPRYAVETNIIPFRSLRSPSLTPIRAVYPVDRTPVKAVAPVVGRVRNVPSLPADVGPIVYPYQGDTGDFPDVRGFSGMRLQDLPITRTKYVQTRLGGVTPMKIYAALTPTLNRSSYSGVPSMFNKTGYGWSSYRKQSNLSGLGYRKGAWGGHRRPGDNPQPPPPCPGGLDCASCKEVYARDKCMCCVDDPATQHGRGKYGGYGQPWADPAKYTQELQSNNFNILDWIFSNTTPPATISAASASAINTGYKEVVNVTGEDVCKKSLIPNWFQDRHDCTKLDPLKAALVAVGAALVLTMK